MASEGGKYYFTADVHLGACDGNEAFRREAFLNFLKGIPEDASGLYLLGDIFDFWVEYRDVVPKGYVEILSELKKIASRGCEVLFFGGNHDWWTGDYFDKELGVKSIREPYILKEIGGRRFCIGHGDLPGISSFKARLTFKVIRNRVLIALLKALPPRWVFGFARGWSAHSRSCHHAKPYTFNGEESDIWKFADELGRKTPVDCFVFGHYHRKVRLPVASGGELYLLGDWSSGEDYLYFSGISTSGGILPNTIS